MDDKILDANDQTSTAPEEHDENAANSVRETPETMESVTTSDTDVSTGSSEQGRHHSGHHHHHHSIHDGSSHHGSGHHHSSRRHSRKKHKSGSAKYLSRRKKLTMWLSKHVSKKKVLRQNLLSIVLALTVFTLLIYIAATQLTHHNGENSYETQADTIPSVEEALPADEYEVIVRLPAMKDIPLIYDFLAEAVRTPSMQTLREQLADKKEQYGRLYIGLPVTLDMSEMAFRNGKPLAPVRVTIAEDEAFTVTREFTLEEGQTKLDIYLLKTGMKYYYRVYFEDTDAVAQGSFTTADSPRLLTITNALNVRDIGGWTTIDGKRIHQGLLYRGTELDGAVEPTHFLTPGGQRDMLEVLGIRYDMDLRGESENTMGTHALGNSVQHVYYGVQMYSGSFNTITGREAMRRVFADLAKPENYPMYVHCTYGCDRTGTVCYILGALLGLSDEDLAIEYELSSLCFPNIDRHNLKVGVDGMQEYDGATTKEKAENYLRSIGVTAEEIASIRAIFLEDIPTN